MAFDFGERSYAEKKPEISIEHDTGLEEVSGVEAVGPHPKRHTFLSVLFS